MTQVFISYRRKDTGAYADRLVERLGSFNVSAWYDRQGIDPGERWENEIRSALSAANIVLALIGRDWLDERLALADDWVRREIALANTMGKTVIPVFFDVDPPLDPLRFPQPLHFLNQRNGYPINGDYFDRDADDFCARIKQQVDALQSSKSTGSKPARLTGVQRQVILMLAILAIVTMGFAIAPTRFPALPSGFWVLPALMLFTTFAFFLYLLAHAHLRSVQAT